MTDDEPADHDGLTIVEPQFERHDDIEPAGPPSTDFEVNRLKQADKETLEKLGLRKWSDETGLWLLPHEWHDYIPEDYLFLTINGEYVYRSDYPETPDKRFGVLSFGIVPEFEKEDGDDE